MGKIIKEKGKIYLEEIQTTDGKHRRLIYLGEDDAKEKTPKRKQYKNKKEAD